MKILAFETAADPGSAALWLDGETDVCFCPDGEANSATLLPLAEAMLHAQGLRYADLDGVAFGAGPGSFTGLRVACGVAQGLAVGCALPLLGVGTLAGMAEASGGERVIALLDARMGEIYYGFFVAGELCGEVGVCAPEDLPRPESGGWLACGNALASYPILCERLQPCVIGWRPEIRPSAAAVVRLAAPRLARGESIDPAVAAPLYVRDKVARTVAERLAEGGCA